MARVSVENKYAVNREPLRVRSRERNLPERRGWLVRSSRELSTVSLTSVLFAMYVTLRTPQSACTLYQNCTRNVIVYRVCKILSMHTLKIMCLRTNRTACTTSPKGQVAHPTRPFLLTIVDLRFAKYKIMVGMRRQ